MSFLFRPPPPPTSGRLTLGDPVAPSDLDAVLGDPVAPPSNLLDVALDHAAQGRYIFPLVPRAKEPLLKASWPDISTNDVETIRNWWTETPDANIGIDCGKSALAVVDVDKPDADLTHLELPTSTYTVATPSGGLHIFVDNSCGSVRSCNFHDVESQHAGEIKAAGGYVVAAGSWVPPKHDEHGPPRPYRVTSAAPIAQSSAALAQASQKQAQRAAERAVAWEEYQPDHEPMAVDELLELDPHLAKRWEDGAKPLAWGPDYTGSGMDCALVAYLVRRGHALETLDAALREYPHGAICRDGEATKGGLERAIERKIDYALRTLDRPAQLPPTGTAADVFAGVPKPAENVGCDGVATGCDGPRLQWRSGPDIARRTREGKNTRPVPLFDKLLPKPGAYALAGETGLNKTGMAYELILARHEGETALGLFGARDAGRCILLSNEEEEITIQDRFELLHADGLEALPNLLVMGAEQFEQVDDLPYLFQVTEDLRVEWTKLGKALQRELAHAPGQLVVLDGFADFVRLPDKNSDDGVRLAIRTLRGMGRQHDACIVALMHPSATARRTGDMIGNSEQFLAQFTGALTLRSASESGDRMERIMARGRQLLVKCNALGADQGPRELMIDANGRMMPAAGGPDGRNGASDPMRPGRPDMVFEAVRKLRDAEQVQLPRQPTATYQTISDEVFDRNKVRIPTKDVRKLVSDLERQGRLTYRGAGGTRGKVATWEVVDPNAPREPTDTEIVAALAGLAAEERVHAGERVPIQTAAAHAVGQLPGADPGHVANELRRLFAKNRTLPGGEATYCYDGAQDELKVIAATEPEPAP